MWNVFYHQYSWLEAKYYDVDFLSLSLRKILNITYLELRESYQYDSEGWEKHYAAVFDRSFVRDERGVDVIDFSTVAHMLPSEDAVVVDDGT